MENNAETVCSLWLLHVFGAGSTASVSLIRAAGSARAVYEGDAAELAERASLHADAAAKLMRERDLERHEKTLAFCTSHGISVLTPSSPEYPKSLLSLADMPVALFVCGTLPDMESTLTCAVVGTRKTSDYGRRMAFDLGRGLADGGAVVVSGLALGADGIAMAAAQSVGGITVGVLGCGIDRVYPREHASLFDRTRERGALVSEYAPGTPPNGYNFPKRNRIISGLCQATAVVEAGESSGSLITARDALFQGREVYAVPANVGETGNGTNALLRDGARVLTSPNDILEKYEFIYPHSIRKTHLPPCTDADVSAIYGTSRRGRAAAAPRRESVPVKETEVRVPASDPSRHVELDGLPESAREVFEAMKPNVPMLPEEIAGTRFAVGDVVASLIMLEIAGAVSCGAGGVYTRSDN